MSKVLAVIQTHSEHSLNITPCMELHYYWRKSKNSVTNVRAFEIGILGVYITIECNKIAQKGPSNGQILQFIKNELGVFEFRRQIWCKTFDIN